MVQNEDTVPEGIEVGGCVVSAGLFEFKKEKGVAFERRQVVFYDRGIGAITDSVQDAKGKPNTYIGKVVADASSDAEVVLVETRRSGWGGLPKPHVFDDDDNDDDGLVPEEWEYESLADLTVAFNALIEWYPVDDGEVITRRCALCSIADAMARASQVAHVHVSDNSDVVGCEAKAIERGIATDGP